MNWTPNQTGQLLALAEAGALTPAQLGEAAETASLAPSRSDWLGAAERLFAIAGALRLAAGLCLGALLALTGQVYQSGADVREIFVA